MASMTPQQIFEYKRSWKQIHVVPLHSDFRFKAVDWCKNYCEPWEWKHLREVEQPYIDHYYFEHLSDALLFEEEFRERKES